MSTPPWLERLKQLLGVLGVAMALAEKAYNLYRRMQ